MPLFLMMMYYRWLLFNKLDFCELAFRHGRNNEEKCHNKERHHDRKVENVRAARGFRQFNN